MMLQRWAFRVVSVSGACGVPCCRPPREPLGSSSRALQNLGMCIAAMPAGGQREHPDP